MILIKRILIKKNVCTSSAQFVTSLPDVTNRAIEVTNRAVEIVVYSRPWPN